MKKTDRQHHVQLSVDDGIGRYCFLPGDPARSELIASRFDRPRKVAQNREYVTWAGELDGAAVAVTSTGIGCPSAAIAVEELTKIGVDTVVRVGTSGAMQPFISPGDLGVVTAAIRDEGTSSHYLPIEFPAVADLDVTNALARGARDSGATVHLGVAQSKDSFYGQHEPGRMPVGARLQERWRAWMTGGAICSEMEAAAIFIVAATLHIRAGGIMMIAGHHDQSPMTDAEIERCSVDAVVDAAVAGFRLLIASDRAAAADAGDTR